MTAPSEDYKPTIKAAKDELEALILKHTDRLPSHRLAIVSKAYASLNDEYDSIIDEEVRKLRTDLRAGASLTPSPVTATMCPLPFRPWTTSNFCSAVTRVNRISGLSSAICSCAEVMRRRASP